MIIGVINFVKNLITPLGTDRARLRISKIAEAVESKIKKNQLLRSKAVGDFSKCIQLRMHLGTTVPQTKSVGVGLKNILTHRDNLSLVNYERYVLLLSLHCHRKRLGNGHVRFNYVIKSHSITASASTQVPYQDQSKE
jgi:hypothetical protein